MGKAGVFQDLGRLAEARQELDRVSSAEQVDDLELGVGVTQYIYERKFGDAVALVQRRLGALGAQEVPDSLVSAVVVQTGFCQDWLGRHDDARQTFTRVINWIRPTPGTVVAADANAVSSTLALAYAGLGDKNAALQQAQRSVAQYDNDAVDKPSTETVLAQIQARFGDIESAISAIPHLLEVPAGITRTDLRLNPLWDPLRNDPRFKRLCEEPTK